MWKKFNVPIAKRFNNLRNSVRNVELYLLGTIVRFAMFLMMMMICKKSHFIVRNVICVGLVGEIIVFIVISVKCALKFSLMVLNINALKEALNKTV